MGVPQPSLHHSAAAVRGKQMQSRVRETKTEHEARDDQVPTAIASETAVSSKEDNSNDDDDDDILTLSLFDETDLGQDDKGVRDARLAASSPPPTLGSSVGCTTSDIASSKSDVRASGVSTARDARPLLPLEDDVVITNSNVSGECSQQVARALESASTTAAIPAVATPSSVSEILDAVVRPLLAEALPQLQQAPSFAIAVSRTDAGVHARAALVSFNLKMKVRTAVPSVTYHVTIYIYSQYQVPHFILGSLV